LPPPAITLNINGLDAFSPSFYAIVSPLTVFALSLLLTHPLSVSAQSLPTGGVVVGGSASIGSSGSLMTINQSSDRAAINWQTFNIGTGNTVQFVQPGSQSITLNRVVGGVPSNIQGALLANGQVWLQNANGVLFSSGSVINVNSLLVTTKNINVDQFMAGNAFDLASTGKNAGIINDGSITAAGYVTLIGDQVRNNGDISAKQVVLAAGDSATVALDNGQGISVTLTNATANALVENSGRIVAGNDGSVLLTTQGKDTLLDTVINLSGIVKAGTIVADAGVTGDVVVTGDLDASNQNGQGGTVVLSGNRVGLFDDATVNVSGDAGGGLAIIGGDNLNKVPGSSAQGLIDKVTFADYTQIDSGVKIDAGSANGDGGFVETSAAVLSVDGTISAAAPNGKSGLWLIDPTDLTISTALTNANTDTSVPNTFKPIAAPTGASIVNNGSIETALGGANVLITTLGSTATGTQAGNITLAANTNITTASGNTNNLTLEAAGNITIGGNISLGGGNLNLTADAGHNGNGAVVQQATSTIDLHNGNLSISGNTTNTNTMAVNLGGTVVNIGTGTITGNANSAAGVYFGGTMHLTVNGTENLTINGTSTTGAGIQQMPTSSFNIINNGSLTLNGKSDAVQGVLLSGTTTVADNGTLNVYGSSANQNGIGLNTNSLLSVTGNGSVTLNGTTNGTTANGVNGVALTGTVLATNGGSLDVNGKANGTGAGVGIGNNATITAETNGTVNMNGISTNGTGVDYQNGTIIANGNGSAININGSSNAGNGVSVNSAINASNAGIVNINGVSNSSALSASNASVYAGVALGSTGVLSSDGNGSLIDVNGTATDASRGIVLSSGSSATMTNSGEIDLSGNTVNGSAGVQMSGNASVDGDGSTLNVTGTSVERSAVLMGSGILNVTNGGAVNLDGTSTNGAGVSVPGTVLTSDGNGSVINLAGEGAVGVYLNSVANATNGGEINFDGLSTCTSGVSIGSSTGAEGVNIGVAGSVWANGTDANGSPSTINVNGSSAEGLSGVQISGSAQGDNGGVLNLGGKSTNGTGVNIGSNGTVSSNGTDASGNPTQVTVNGTSTNGSGVNNNGTAEATNSGVLTIIGNSTNGTGVDNQNGTITAIGNGSEVTVNGTSTNGNAGVDNTNGTMTEVAGGNITVNSNPPMIGNPVVNASVSSGSSGSGGHGGGGGGGSNGVAIGGGILIAGLVGYAIYDHKAAASDSPQAMTEEDGKVAEATLDSVSVNADGTEAVVKVRTARGVAERRLTLKDSGDGVRHFALNDAGVSTELSFNPQTREYFYRESGAAKNLKAHGWLKEVVASR
jgi:filamentous hemagglutinin family protein